MINAQELLFVVDEQNTPLDPLPRELVHEQKVWHRTTQIWIINNKNEVLCQKRSMAKDIKPGYWEPFFGGHVLANENQLMNAVNELHQELGLYLSASAFATLFTWRDETYKEFQFIYKVYWAGELEEITLEKEEIDDLKWVSNGEIQNIISSKHEGWSIPSYSEKIHEILK